MKKRLKKLLLILGMMIVLMGCGEEKEAVSEPTSKMTEEVIENNEPITTDTKNELTSINNFNYDHKDIIKEYEDAGFTNVKAEGREDIYDEKLYKENSVIEVAVNNETSSLEEKYEADTPIVVYYRIFKEEPKSESVAEKVAEPAQQPEPQPESQPAAVSQPEPQVEPQPAAASQPESAAAPQPESQSQPAPPPQQSSNGQSVTVPEHNESGPNLVWVPTKGGKKYHTGPGCSGMEELMQVSVETAEANGYTPCKRCH